MKNHAISLLNAIDALKQATGKVSVELMKQPGMSLEYFSPQMIDTQTPHTQDELYIIVRGHGKLNRNGELIICKAGDALFVPAQMPHHFEDFSDDFATWVIFFN
jgi:mannose-6-phosphate isomerase-like protein (cupin superfamily)